MSFFHEINVTELRDGITSLHGIHDFQYELQLQAMVWTDIKRLPCYSKALHCSLQNCFKNYPKRKYPKRLKKAVLKALHTSL